MQIEITDSKKILEIISMNYQSEIKHLQIELADFSQNKWSNPTFDENTCIFKTQINPEAAEQVYQFDNINFQNINRIKRIVMVI